MNARTIESVLDLRTGKEIQASDFFSKPIDEIFKLRYEFESGIREKKPRVVCFFCKQSIKIRGRVDSKRILHFAHLKDSDDCPQKTDNTFTKEEILRIKYNGVKESDLHIDLKTFIAKSLAANQNAAKGIEFVAIEHVYKHQAIPKVWKKPDVSSVFQGKPVVFELQLSTTFLSVINSRQEFYKENQTFILWVFSTFETNEDRRKFTQSDVFFSNNRNAFELDDLAKEKSIHEDDLVLKCNYQKPVLKNDEIQYEWEYAYIRLGDLTFDQNTYKVYYFDVDKAEEEIKAELEIKRSALIQAILNSDIAKISDLFLRHHKIGEREKKYIIKLYDSNVKPKNVIDLNTPEYCIIWATLCLKLDEHSLLKEFINDYKLNKTITDILSLKLNKIIGYAFKKQIQIAHQLIDRRPEYLNIYLTAINKYQPALFKEQDTTHKLRAKIDKKKYSVHSLIYNERIIAKIFPELVTKK